MRRKWLKEDKLSSAYAPRPTLIARFLRYRSPSLVPLDEAGGRKGYRESGYWGQFHYEHTDWEVGHDFDNPPIAFPGETRIVKFLFMSPDKHLGRLGEGAVFLLREGSRVIGYGQVTALLDLERHANERLEELDRATGPDPAR